MQSAQREQPRKLTLIRAGLPLHGWIGLGLALLFWSVNWTWEGPRTQWAFFPMWLGYCLTVDGLVFWRKGNSLLTRDWRKYIGLFLISAPVWWAFELLNLRTQNWEYLGIHAFSSLAYAFWTTLSFTTVVPAVFGSAELLASFSFIKRIGKGPIDDRGIFCGRVGDAGAVAGLARNLLPFHLDVAILRHRAGQCLAGQPHAG